MRRAAQPSFAPLASFAAVAVLAASSALAAPAAPAPPRLSPVASAAFPALPELAKAPADIPAGERVDGLELQAAPWGGGKQTEMGRKAMVPYGLYRAYGFFNPHFARQTGVIEEDLELFWAALQQMWDLDRSASRGLMACRGLYVFSHDSPLGNAPAHQLFERVSVDRKPDVAAPRRFDQYEVAVAEDDLPPGVTLTRIVG